MIGLLQRVVEASVDIEGSRIAVIGPGLMVLACAERGDRELEAERLAERIIKYRVFSDAHGKMNLSLRDVGGSLLLVPQFTLAADTKNGARPSFTASAPPEVGRRLFEHLLASACSRHSPVVNGKFGAHMRVSFVNDGPVTFWLQVSAQSGGPGRSAAAADVQQIS